MLDMLAVLGLGGGQKSPKYCVEPIRRRVCLCTSMLAVPRICCSSLVICDVVSEATNKCRSESFYILKSVRMIHQHYQNSECLEWLEVPQNHLTQTAVRCRPDRRSEFSMGWPIFRQIQFILLSMILKWPLLPSQYLCRCYFKTLMCCLPDFVKCNEPRISIVRVLTSQTLGNTQNCFWW